MTTLEIILISYILLSWFLIIMYAILPKRVADKVVFIFIIICPPLIIGVIGDLIKRKHDKRKEKKEKKEEKNDYA
jgi:ACR3 family arsenite efflux pump ArsB